MLRSVIAIILTALVSTAMFATASQQENSRQLDIQSTNPTNLMSYTGSCGGTVKDKNGYELTCPSTHRPECDKSGYCRCVRDNSCQG